MKMSWHACFEKINRVGGGTSIPNQRALEKYGVRSANAALWDIA